jgi:hypothetical protein
VAKAVVPVVNQRIDLPGIAVEGSSVRLTRIHAGFVAALTSTDS